MGLCSKRKRGRSSPRDNVSSTILSARHAVSLSVPLGVFEGGLSESDVATEVLSERTRRIS